MARKLTRKPDRTIKERSANRDHNEARRLEHSKSHYRSIATRFAIATEKEFIAWFDYQPSPKIYLKKLMLRDMQEHPEEVKKAVELYDKLQEETNDGIDLPLPKGIVRIKCKYCGYETDIRNKSDKPLPEHKLICPMCRETNAMMIIRTNETDCGELKPKEE